MAALTIIALGSVFYAYFGYPLVLWLILKGRKTNSRIPDGRMPESVSIIIAARNEEARIKTKLIETLALPSPKGTSVEILVASDCSDDRTDEIVREFSNVRLVRSEERKGKEHAQSLAIEEAKGEILVFSDTKVSLDQNLLVSFCETFKDPTIGAVSSIDVVIAPEGGGSGEGFYVRYEMFLRKLESKFRTLIGLSGSCFAVRRTAVEGFRSDIPSDFALLINAVRKGFRGVLDEKAICRYHAVKTEEEEFQRKSRTIVRGMTALAKSCDALNPVKYGSFAWQLFSHKIMRWLVPWCFLFATVGSLLLSNESWFFLLLAYGFLAFYIAAAVAYFNKDLRGITLLKIPLFFVVSNGAVALATLKFLSGERTVLWSPSAKAG